MKRRVGLAIVVMGFTGLVAEVVLLREFLIVFSGNELCIGIVLGNWLVLEAFGCLLAGRLAEKSSHRLEAFVLISLLFSLSFVAAVLAARSIKSVLGVSIGESLGLVPVVGSSLAILLPVSVLHGALFPFACRILAALPGDSASSAGKVYVLETVGTIVGGVVSTWLLVPHLNSVWVSVGLAMLNGVMGLLLLASRWKAGRYQQALLVGLTGFPLACAYLLASGVADGLHQQSVRAQWKPLHVVHYENSPYGNFCVVENESQYLFFQDGVLALITPVPDMVSVEEFVHLALLAHPKPARVLILSGGAGGVIHEVLRHRTVQAVEYAELDPLLIALLRRYPTALTETELSDARVRLHHVDGRLLLRTAPGMYDVIFVGVEPSNLQTNRFFTREFFSLAKARLNDGGVLVLGIPSSLTLLTEGLKDLNGSVFRTLRSAFMHVVVIPGDSRNIFMASESPSIAALDRSIIVQRLAERGLSAGGTLPWHIENRLHDGWQEWFARLVQDASEEINQDFRPMAIFYSMAHWNAVFAPSFGRAFIRLEHMHGGMILALLALFTVSYLLLRTRAMPSLRQGASFSILTTGFAGMMFDLSVIVAFQVIHGYVFLWIGLLVASFMGGAAVGAMLMTSIRPRAIDERRLFLATEIALILVSFGLPPVFVALNEGWASQQSPTLLMVFPVIAAACGWLTGIQFPLANRLLLRNNDSLTQTAGVLYASDLLGGWLGGVVGAVVLLPVLGLAGACLAVGALKLMSAMVFAIQTRAVPIRR